jgi:hypothetical protein
MNETRQQLKARLQQEGKWQDFLALREQLKASGLPPDQAREEALRQVESRPPKPPELANPGDPPTVGAPVQSPAVEELGPDFSLNVPNYEAAQWVASQIANTQVRAQDAPSGLAWGLLQWVRFNPANQTTFWSSIWPRMLPSGAALQKQQETAEVQKVDGGYERLKKLLDGFQDGQG